MGIADAPCLGPLAQGTLLKQPSSSERSDFPTPRGYEQAVHPPFNNYEYTPNDSYDLGG